MFLLDQVKKLYLLCKTEHSEDLIARVYPQFNRIFQRSLASLSQSQTSNGLLLLVTFSSYWLLIIRYVALWCENQYWVLEFTALSSIFSVYNIIYTHVNLRLLSNISSEFSEHEVNFSNACCYTCKHSCGYVFTLKLWLVVAIRWCFPLV